MRTRAERLLALQRSVTRILAHSVALEDAGALIVRAICEELAWDSGSLWLTSPVGRSLADAAWVSGEVHFVSDVSQTTRRTEAAGPQLARTGAAFAFPIVTAAGVAGVFELHSRERKAGDSNFLASMRGLGSQIGQFVDYLEAKRALQSTREQLAHSTRLAMLEGLTVSIAHEVNQPLTGIVTNADAALRWLSRTPPQLQEANAALGRLARDGRRAGEIVARLRALVRQGARSEKSDLDANGVIRETISLVRSEATQSRILVEPDLAPALPAVHADPVQLQQVVLNLLVNALEALSQQHRRPRRLIVESRDEDARHIVVRVIDNAAGLRGEDATRIFDPFFTTKPQGLGMGLTISRSIIEEHGGRLSVSSNEAGTTFELTLLKAAATSP